MSTPGILNFPLSLNDQVSLIETANSVQSILASGITSGAAALSLADASLFPDSGVATIQAMQAHILGAQTVLLPSGLPETIAWIAKAGNDLTGLLRGQQGSVAAAHNAGDYVQMRITKKHHEVLAGGIMAIEEKLGIGASSPTAGKILRSLGIGASSWEAATFEHIQAAPSALWTITHGLAAHPAVHTVDTGGDEIEGDVIYVSVNQLTIGFSQAIAGRAYLN